MILLPNLLTELDKYSSLSSFRIHFQKPEALNISLPEYCIGHLKTNFPFKWVMAHIRYLGTNLSRNLGDTFENN